jgi:uncharacterized protein YsxB (DUF464 family)
VGEVLIRRDERNRVTGVVVRGVAEDVAPGATAVHLLQTAAASLAGYLHVAASWHKRGNTLELAIDRCDTHLDRELDAVLETLVIGLRMLEREYPADLVVEEPAVGVEV